VQLFCGYLATILALWLVPMLSAAWSWRWSLASLSLGPALSVLALLLLRPRAKDVDEAPGETLGMGLRMVKRYGLYHLDPCRSIYIHL
jgi:predicted MFS family arabinose efflux permease